ncbi:hypothetical protein J6590_007092 [Homalodisca vitripennis]|nr:hypothetical protein J6590_007092 [Homalodisca vitripennis]
MHTNQRPLTHGSSQLVSEGLPHLEPCLIIQYPCVPLISQSCFTYEESGVIVETELKASCILKACSIAVSSHHYDVKSRMKYKWRKSRRASRPLGYKNLQPQSVEAPDHKMRLTQTDKFILKT